MLTIGVTIGYGDGTQTSADAVKVSASQSKMNSNGTTYQNGRFVNVDEVHNNTKNMTLSGFNQEGGTVTGNIENLTIESKQNTSITKGSTKGGKGKVVGITSDGKVVANMAGRNVIFENGKQNTISAGSFKKFEIPKTNEVVEVPTEVITKNNTKKVPENMFNGILDKVKSKITGKPVAQVQLEKIGIKSEVKDIGLKVDGTTKTGLDIDEALENNLGRTFKTYDSYDEVTKIATSVKSVDMTSKTYTSGSGLSSKLNSDLKAIKDFTEYELDKVRLENKDIEVRVLKIVINNEPLNKSQMENLKKVVDHATEDGIKVEAVILK